jgi:hypothetical protein
MDNINKYMKNKSGTLLDPNSHIKNKVVIKIDPTEALKIEVPFSLKNVNQLIVKKLEERGWTAEINNSIWLNISGIGFSAESQYVQQEVVKATYDVVLELGHRYEIEQEEAMRKCNEWRLEVIKLKKIKPVSE